MSHLPTNMALTIFLLPSESAIMSHNHTKQADITLYSQNIRPCPSSQ
jgi:hypothetical protein